MNWVKIVQAAPFVVKATRVVLAVSQGMVANYKAAVLSAELEKEPVKPRRKRDTTKFTQVHFDAIHELRADWCRFNERNPTLKRPLQRLFDQVNDEMGMQKSNRAIARVWDGSIKRGDLPVGEKLTQSEEQ